MSNNNDFPHSAEYLARQAARQKALARFHEKSAWTDAQIIADRSVAYVAQERSYIGPQIANAEREMQDDPDTEGYVAKYHTDEG